jgi:hypothetical protein
MLPLLAAVKEIFYTPGMVGSILIRQHDRDDRLARVARPAGRLQPHQGRGVFAVVVPDMDAEANLGPASASTDRTAKHP